MMAVAKNRKNGRCQVARLSEFRPFLSIRLNQSVCPPNNLYYIENPASRESRRQIKMAMRLDKAEKSTDATGDYGLGDMRDC